MGKGTNWNKLGLVLSAWTVLAAPAVGFIATTLQVQSAFQQTSTVEPAEKARTLAEGISTSMNAAAIGSGIGFYGALHRSCLRVPPVPRVEAETAAGETRLTGLTENRFERT
jgi:hypothetical protein